MRKFKVLVLATTVCAMMCWGTGCGSRVSGQSTAPLSGGYAAYFSNGVFYLQFTETQGDLLGKLDTFIINFGNSSYDVDSRAFKGKLNEKAISIEFTGSGLSNLFITNQIWTGYTDDKGSIIFSLDLGSLYEDSYGDFILYPDGSITTYSASRTSLDKYHQVQEEKIQTLRHKFDK